MPTAPSYQASPASERAWSSVVAGAVMVLAGLLLANPQGAKSTEWPWQILARWPWDRIDANWAIWYLTAVLAIVLGWNGARSWRAPLLGGLGLLLLVTCCSGKAGIVLGNQPYLWYVGVSTLATGLLLEIDGRRPRAARAACVLGGFTLIAMLAVLFGPSPEGTLRSHLEQVPTDVIRRALGQAVPDAREGYEILLLAAAASLLAALLGLARGVGLRGGLVARIALLLLLLDFLIPTFHKLGSQFASTITVAAVFSTLSEVLVHSGLALSLLLTAAGVDLARLSEPEA
jgi:hypothetical protein